MNADLAEELHRRAEADQAARRLADETGGLGDMGRVDAENTAWLKAVLVEHGWPGFVLVGAQGADDAWLLAQHADQDPDFQAYALELLAAAVADGDASRRHLAYLTDRVLVARGEPQVYGTQYVHEPDGSNLRLQPVADMEGLDERRAAMGLESAADYDRRMRSRRIAPAPKDTTA